MKFGRLELIIGCMFSGKTTELIRRVKRLSIKNKVLVVNSDKDSRCDDGLVQTHDKNSFTAIKTGNFSNVNIGDYDVIAVDEGQFFENLVQFVKVAVNVYHKHVIVAGLDGDFRREKFGYILDLVPFAEKIDKLDAICHRCGDLANFTHRIVSNNEVEIVGGGDAYMAVCRKCFDTINNGHYSKTNTQSQN